ncbi:MAG: hypothetical protein K2Y71_05350 [Xanthobacteraceae bacterium]|nr:hypothetical protein [Xanthobacteraceae bacterium]
MCFSATASFTAAAVAGSIGAVALWQACKLGDRALLPIAAFPALFAAQQTIEGLLWLDLARPTAGACRPFLTHAFTAYAEVFWPVFAPLAAWLIEPVRWRRHLIGLCLAIGVALSAYLLWKMLGNPYTASAATGHIVYSNGATYPKAIEVPYVLATTISLLLSSHRVIQLLAVVILGGFAVAYWSYRQSYISVWCFFAAVSSIIVYLFVHRAAQDGQKRTR